MVSRLRLVLEAVLGSRRREKMASTSGGGGGGGSGGGGTKMRGFSVNPKDYKLMEEVGYGASAVVRRAIYIPTNQVVAIKCLDLDRCNSNLDDIRREAQTMTLIDHPNVIKSFCSFSVEHYLWVVMPFMAQGSCLHLMKAAYPDGFEEAAICSMLKETLKALDYLHRQGHIHRDVKAGNILLDNTGEIKLGDFGVSACLFDNGDRQRARNTFVGTPCWMAPEVLQPGSGYNSKADIWSFGITALELAHGHAPFSKYPPMKVLLMTIQNAPPGLDYDRDKKFSKSFKELVALCLVKDQTKRPTAEKLLKHSFFKNAKPPEICVKKLFADLPPLWTRVKALQAKDAAQIALKGMASADQDAISQSEYQRGVSAWNFNIEDLKEQASLLDDDDILTESREEDESFGEQLHNKVNDRGQVSGNQLLSENMNGKEKGPDTEVVEPIREEKSTLNSTATSVEQAAPSSEQDVPQAKGKPVRRQTHSGPLSSGNVVITSDSEKGPSYERSDSERLLKPSVRRAPSFSGPLNLPNRASANSFSAPIKSSGGFRDSIDDKSKANVVQIKGRFSVTSENLDLARGSPLRKSASVGSWLLDSKMPTGMPIKESSTHHASSVIMPHLQNLFHQNSIQQDQIMNLLNTLQQAAEATDGSQNGKLPPLPRGSDSNGTVVELTASERERLLFSKITELRVRMKELTEELEEEKSKQIQLQQKLKLVTGRDKL
ncbi:PREDICTED: serine/threonine-protein kinase BLUS1-like [Camelina sativa]|uniref:Serine/threonine-protein kinase BLUS1-like n=1 Tax=Camelina sativa TaxID=90675 RepID=A0ABM0U6R3_CAMSA|nr:PREDICTED: serine/threonine-protein kinase BLUS1-like [Camelina sativa]